MIFKLCLYCCYLLGAVTHLCCVILLWFVFLFWFYVICVAANDHGYVV